MHFQLYIPGVRGQDPKTLVDVGLADFVAGSEYAETAEGPGELGAGVVVAWRKPGQAHMGFQPECQTWLPAAKCGADLAAARYFIGFWNDSPAGARDLARPYPQPGSRVMLGDGQEWMLPVAKSLDADMILADDGTWRFEPQRRFHAFYLEYLKWFQFFGTASQDDAFSYADAADFVLSALRVNYRLTPEAASHLRLFTKESVTAALFAVMGIEHKIEPPSPDR